jgi:hypothetical protein
MAKNRLSSADGPGFIRAFTDNWEDIESTYGVYLQMRVSPTPRKGVIELRISAWKEQERRGSFPQAAYTGSYPSAAVETFEACFFQAMARLARILEGQARWPAGKEG